VVARARVDREPQHRLAYLAALCDVLGLGRDVALDLGLQLARHGGRGWSLAGEAFVDKTTREGNFFEAGARSRLSSFLSEKGASSAREGSLPESVGLLSGKMSRDGGGDIVSRLSSSTSPAEVIKELGYGCTASADYFKRVIGLMPAFGARELAKVVAMLASTRDSLDVSATDLTLNALAAAVGLETPQRATSWNYENAADALRDARPDADWAEAMMLLGEAGASWTSVGDIENREVDARAPEAVLRMFARATDGAVAFPVEAMCSGAAWESAAAPAQLAFLAHATTCSLDVFNWRACRRVMPPVTDLSGGANPVGTPNHAWLSLDLYLTLDALARGGGVSPARARRAFDAGLGACPDVVALGAASAMSEEAAAQGGVLA